MVECNDESTFYSLLLFHPFPDDDYTQTNVDSGCCVSNGTFHRRCECNNVPDVSCRSLCSNDTGCKGYVMFGLIDPSQCQIATISTCPDVCYGPVLLTNVEKLDPKAVCTGGHEDWNGGCFIKAGISQYNPYMKKLNYL